MKRSGKFMVESSKPSLDFEVPTIAKDPELRRIKQQHIVDCASKLFFEKGFHPTTIRDIAKACKMSMGQLYHYINSKDDVLFLVHRHMQRMWYNHLVESGVDGITSPEEKLKAALRVTLELMTSHRKLFQFIYTESKYLDRQHLHVVLHMDDENVVGFWRRLLAGVNKTKWAKDDIDFLANLLAYLLVFLPLRGWNLKKRSTSKNVEYLIDFILRGLALG